MKNLVIVESPAKAKTISSFLGSDFIVKASMGHIRDLPKNKLGFDPANNFEPAYEVTVDKKKTVSELKKLIKKDTVIYLAADEDREGEAIAWHLIPSLKIEKNEIKRIVFHEITKNAILEAIKNPREVNLDLVDAQQARRVLDRAVGYELSPLLWKKVKPGLSAGRVQSVAVRIIVDREREIRAFEPEEFWKIKSDFLSPAFRAELAKIDQKTAKVKNSDEANEIKKHIDGFDFEVSDIEEKEGTKTPAPPFTTSTLQQEASRKLGFSVKQTMSVAQQLYEGNIENAIPNHIGGLITYMRTDSLNLSDIALKEAKEMISEEFGDAYALKTPRKFKSSAKGAQEAHEAIRPVNMFLKPSQVEKYLDKWQFKLYELIWKRTVATQMQNAKIANTTYKIDAGDKKQYEFISKGHRVIFAGFMKAYTEGSDDADAAIESADKILPDVKIGQILPLKELLLEQNFTKPPARYTEASLVKKLESEGIGRPSTYAPTISTIQAREYVIKTEDKKLAPTEIGEIVNDFLVEHFSNIVDLGFTAKIEEEFDEIADGKIKWQEVMKEFYTDFHQNIAEKEKTAERVRVNITKVLGNDPKTGKEVSAKSGRFGPYIQLGSNDDEIKPVFVSIPKDKSLETITFEDALALLSLPKLPRVLGTNQNGDEISANTGRFGPYVQVKKEFFSIKKESPYEITLERALEIIEELSQKKANALIADFQKEKIQILEGRYGPYIKQGRKNYKIPKGSDPKELSAEQCLQIISEQTKK